VGGEHPAFATTLANFGLLYKTVVNYIDTAIGATSAGDPLQSSSSLCCPGAPAEEPIATLLGVLSWLERTVLGAQLKTTHTPRLLHIATLGFFLPAPLGEENSTYSSIIIQIKHNFE
jgi:hypothetical protein